ncbi:MAG: NADH-quinone oxidoreductase subunit NuoG [Rickettsiales bacterium]|nr:NADH-quinone oxidoreductase subunit NuoG [Rickettsiales bacterium]
MPTVTINGKNVSAPEGITIIQACEIADVEIPRFCYHERLAIAGNCRMCLVEVEGMPPKPVASCAMPIVDGMKIHTDSPMVKKAREGVMEFLLANHPLDCPICDQGGECDLQDQAFQYGAGKSAFHEHKRAVKDKDFGPLVKTQMTRCIHCTRCVRFIEDVAGTCEIGATSRGESMEITTYLEQNLKSELSGNVIDLCPVGALTSKPYAFKARSWELKKTESIDVMDALGCNIRIDSRGLEVMRILPRLHEEINEEWISDKARFCYDGLKYQRLDKSYVKKHGKLTAVEFDEALEAIAQKIKTLKIENSSGDEIAAFTGALSSAEEIFALKNLVNKLGSNNIDCRLNGEKINSQNRADYLFNSTIAGIDEADACLLIGVNPRKDAPVLNARLRKRFLTKQLKVAAVACEADLTYNYDNLGDAISALQNILDGEAKICSILQNAQKPMLILGSDLLTRNDGALILQYAKKIAEKFGLIKENWNGFNFLAKSSGFINGLEVGFTPNQADIDVHTILQKIEKTEIKLIFLHGVDDDIDFLKLENCFVIYIGSHGDKGANIADVILPAAAYSEKEALFVNIEGRVQSTKRAVFAPNNVLDDWQVILKLAEKLNLDLGFKNLAQLRQALIVNYPIFANLDKISQANWINCGAITGELNPEKLLIKDYNFYLTNPIARASRTLNKCAVS